MMLRLRQICLVAHSLEPAVPTLCKALDAPVCYHDPQVAKYGLENAVVPVGNTFLEVVAPIRDGTAAGRYLVRRKGEGGYMTILDTDAIEPWFDHLVAVGVRVANDLNYPDEYRGLQLHPKDTGGTLLEINWSPGGALDGPYHPAGPNWHGAKGEAAEAAITSAEIQADDPVALARRWSRILRRPMHAVGSVPTITLDLGTLRFVPVRDGRGEGLGGIGMRVARSANTPADLMICGTRMRLVSD
jgi:hypothetical protein